MTDNNENLEEESPQAQTPKQVREANRKKVDLSISPQAVPVKEYLKNKRNTKKIELRILDNKSKVIEKEMDKAFGLGKSNTMELK